MQELPLIKMKTGSRGTVLSLSGGPCIKAKLEALGLRPGSEIMKISAQLLKGPVVVRAGKTTIAMGYGMAHKIIVSVE